MKEDSPHEEGQNCFVSLQSMDSHVLLKCRRGWGCEVDGGHKRIMYLPTMQQKSVVAPRSCSKLTKNKVFSAQFADIVSRKCPGNVQMFTDVHRSPIVWRLAMHNWGRKVREADRKRRTPQVLEHTPFYSHCQSSLCHRARAGNRTVALSTRFSADSGVIA